MERSPSTHPAEQSSDLGTESANVQNTKMKMCSLDSEPLKWVTGLKKKKIQKKYGCQFNAKTSKQIKLRTLIFWPFNCIELN